MDQYPVRFSFVCVCDHRILKVLARNWLDKAAPGWVAGPRLGSFGWKRCSSSGGQRFLYESQAKLTAHEERHEGEEVGRKGPMTHNFRCPASWLTFRVHKGVLSKAAWNLIVDIALHRSRRHEWIGAMKSTGERSGSRFQFGLPGPRRFSVLSCRRCASFFTWTWTPSTLRWNSGIDRN